MGSRIMHSIIGYKIVEALSIGNRTSFLLGSIAPDAVLTSKAKDLSHFYAGNIGDNTRRICYDTFFQKYRLLNVKDEAYLLGYYAHLIADDIWLKGFYLAWLRNRMANNNQLHELYHRDFKLLNGKLLEHYSINLGLHQILSRACTIPDLEEVKALNVEKFLHSVLEDMEYGVDCLEENLCVFSFDQIVGYVETSIELGINKIKKVI